MSPESRHWPEHFFEIPQTDKNVEDEDQDGSTSFRRVPSNSISRLDVQNASLDAEKRTSLGGMRRNEGAFYVILWWEEVVGSFRYIRLLAATVL